MVQASLILLNLAYYESSSILREEINDDLSFKYKNPALLWLVNFVKKLAACYRNMLEHHVNLFSYLLPI